MDVVNTWIDFRCWSKVLFSNTLDVIRSDSFGSSLIWVCTVCKCHFVRKLMYKKFRTTTIYHLITILGPVVQSVVSLTSSLRVISLTVLADSIYNIMIFFAEKM